MQQNTTRPIAIFLLLWWPATILAQPAGSPPPATPLSEFVTQPYLTLLDQASQVSYPKDDFDALRKQIKKDRDQDEKRVKREQKELESQLKSLRSQLKKLNDQRSTDTAEMKEERDRVHCEIQRLETDLRDKKLERNEGIRISYENKLAKLDLVELWPAKEREIERVIIEERARQRRYGDVEDIGFRSISEDQEKDIKLGEEAIRDLKLYGMMPPELEDEEVNSFVQTLGLRIAANSDVTVPVKVKVLRSEEINAFALPGGFLFVNTGLLKRAESESELAGVIAHELAHVSARHGSKLMKRATIASVMFQLAQVVAAIFTGGIAGIGTYYALQYGFFGLGMVLDLSLLGISRDFEAEADQLGTQYSWKAGYDPRGFITFFDKMASDKGGVTSMSFFRTHPAFFDRIVSTMSEIEYLPRKDDLIVDSLAFQQFKKQLDQQLQRKPLDDPQRPSLLGTTDCSKYERPDEAEADSNDDAAANDGVEQIGALPLAPGAANAPVAACGVCYSASAPAESIAKMSAMRTHGAATGMERQRSG